MKRGIRSIVTLGLAASLAPVASSATAQDAPARDTLLLNTACFGLKDAVTSPTKPSESTGAGAFDPAVGTLTMADGSVRILVVNNDTGAWRNNSSMVSRYHLLEFKKDGLTVLKQDKWLGSARFNLERHCMRPVVASVPAASGSGGHFVITCASEDNGTSNNPRTVMHVLTDAADPVLDMEGIAQDGKKYTRVGELGPDVGAIAGRDNNQQQGASTVYFLGRDGDGDARLAFAVQENNQASYVSILKLHINAPGTKPGATLSPISNLTLLQGEAVHNRPTCAVAPGINQAEFACASVHGDQQPAEKGITVGRFDGRTGALLSVTDVARPSPTREQSVTTPTLREGALEVPYGTRLADSQMACADATCSSYILSTSNVIKSNRQGRGNEGHSPGRHSLHNILVAGDLTAQSFTALGNVAHSHMLPIFYGPGAGAPAIASLSAPLTGSAAAFLQVLPVNSGARTVAAAEAINKFRVANFSNVGDVPASGLRNPEDQGRGFIHATSFANPGALGGVMAGITRLIAAPMPHLGSGNASFMGLDLCFVPVGWDAAYKVAPGAVVRFGEVLIGPPPDPANPNGPLPGGGIGDPSANSDYSRASGEGGCSTSGTAPMGSGAAGFLLLGAMTWIAAAFRRRSPR